VERLTPTPEQATALAQNRDALRALWLRNVLPAVARRWVWWSVIHQKAAAYNIRPSDIVGPELSRINDELDGHALVIAHTAAELGAGRAIVQPWTIPGEGGPVLYMGIVKRSRGGLGFPGILLGAWLLAPKIISFAVAAVVSTGIFILADAWLDGQRAEAEANRALQKTRLKIAGVIADVAKRDPTAAAALADALKQADVLADDQSALDNLINAAAGLTETVVESATGSGWLPWALGFWWLSQRKAS